MTRVNKVEVLNNIIENCERKIIDIKLEIRVLERRKISESTSSNNLIALSNQITGNKDLIGYYEEKIAVANDELQSESKRNTTSGSPDPKGPKG